jgi:hypothetical protein
MKNKTTILLGIVFVVLLVVYFATSFHPPEVTKGSEPLFEGTKPDIDRIEINTPGQGQTILAKREGAWYIEKPFEYKADDRFVNSLVQEIQDVMIDGIVSDREEAQAKYAVTDTTGAGLIVYSGGKTVFDGIVGKRSENIGYSYARRRGKKNIELWRSMLAQEIRRDAFEWRDRTIYSINQDDIIKIEAVEGKTTRTLVFADTVWVYTENGTKKPVDNTKARSFAALVAELQCDDFAGPEEIQAIQERNFDAAITFTVRNGDVHTYHIWKPVQENGRYVMRPEGGDLLYRFYQTKGSQLMVDYERLKPGS